MKGIVCVITSIVVLAAGVVRGQDLPVPKRLVDARTAYLANGGVDLRAMEELHEHLRAWGRLTFVDDELKADIIITLERLATGERSGSAVTFNPDSVAPTSVGGSSERQAWVLSGRAPNASAPLHGDREKIGTGEFGGIKHLVTRLRETVDRGRVDTVAPAVAEAATPAPAPPATTEPCRVFVTETMVNPAWFTAMSRVKYSKKWYGSGDVALRALAQKAWDLNADAVVAVDLSFRPSMWSWASPHASGNAVKWTEEGRKNWSTLNGQCFDRERK